jgi:hypothetical protein
MFSIPYHVRLAFGLHPVDGVDGQEGAVLLPGEWKPCEAQNALASHDCLEPQPEDMVVSKWELHFPTQRVGLGKKVILLI